MVNEFSHHAVPLPLVILSSIFAISHQLHLIGEAQNVGELFEQVEAVALKAIISIQGLIRFLMHDIGIFLERGRKPTLFVFVKIFMNECCLIIT